MAKKFTYKPPKRFAVGTKVRVRTAGVDGVVVQMDEERTSLAEYWHTVETKHGERREPGCNLELIPEPITHPKPAAPQIGTVNINNSHNARFNLNSIDNSTNIASEKHELFAALNEKAQTISDELERAKVVTAIAEMETAHNSGGFLAAYQNFIAIASDHITVFGPLLAGLATLLSGHPH